MIYVFLSNNPSLGDINSSNLSCLKYIWYITCAVFITLQSDRIENFLRCTEPVNVDQDLLCLH